MPELHQDNEDYIINNKIIPTNNQGIKKKLQRKTPVKTNIFNEKFGQIAGPQGGGTLNGAAMKSEAKTEMDSLLEQLKMYVDGSQPLTFVIG